MSENLKIKLKIANRVYPLSVSPDQESSLRSSANKINNTIQQLEKNYAVQDKQDVLAMCSLQYAAQLDQNNKGDEMNQNDLPSKLQELSELIDLHLSNY